MDKVFLRKLGLGSVMVFFGAMVLAGCQTVDVQKQAASQQQDEHAIPAVPSIHGPDSAPKVKGPTPLSGVSSKSEFPNDK